MGIVVHPLDREARTGGPRARRQRAAEQRGSDGREHAARDVAAHAPRSKGGRVEGRGGGTGEDAHAGSVRASGPLVPFDVAARGAIRAPAAALPGAPG